jgi:multiple sugar transport system permease protein
VNANLLFAVGTLATWLGWGLAIRAVILAFQTLTGQGSRYAAALTSALLAALALIGGETLVRTTGSKQTEAAALHLPLVWFSMPAFLWLAILAAIMVLVRLAQVAMSIDATVRGQRLRSTGGWLGAIVICLWLYFRDPANKVEIFRGGIGFSPSTFAIVLLLLLASLFAMVLAAKSTTTLGFAKSAVAQAALVAGSVVFGVPFAFLLITSFKEDRDMSSPNGIVWVPKVQVTKPYLNRKDPLYSTDYNAQTVQGSVIQESPGGRVRLDIFKPLAIRGTTFDTDRAKLKEIARDVPVVTVDWDGTKATGIVIEDMEDGSKRVQVSEPESLKGRERIFEPAKVEPVRVPGLRLENYSEALSYLPPETNGGLVYLKNTLLLVVLSVVGTVLSSSIVAYAFSRMRFPARDAMFQVLLATMMLPGAVTLLPQFLIYRAFGWIDTLFPLWVPAFFASAFNVFLLRQFFMQIPMELEDASKIDGCSYLKTFWDIMMPQIKPALAVIAIWTFMGAWNNFMGPLIYINSPENMPLSYALQLFQGDRSGEPGLLMAFATLCMLPVLALFFFAQRYFIEGVTLSGLGGR